jgi:hypothetical protein
MIFTHRIIKNIEISYQRLHIQISQDCSNLTQMDQGKTASAARYLMLPASVSIIFHASLWSFLILFAAIVLDDGNRSKLRSRLGRF